MELAEDGEKSGGTAKARQDFPQSITADSIRDHYQSYFKNSFGKFFRKMGWNAYGIPKRIDSILNQTDRNIFTLATPL